MILALIRGFRSHLRSRSEIHQEMSGNCEFHPVYLTMLVLAALISLFGLLLNSPAVIIGAMLISPMMGPILSCGLALTTADWKLGKRAARNLTLSVVESIFITALVMFFSPLREPTAEILARTQPNLLDLLVAICSGIAGTLALASKSAGATIIPGVAIATAVMPPLATIGFGISTRRWDIASGATMLFITNLTAIITSADAVFLLVGFHPPRRVAEGEQGRFLKYRFVLASVLMAVLAIPLVRTLMRAVQQGSARNTISAGLTAELQTRQAQLSTFSFVHDDTGYLVEAVVRTPRYLGPQTVAAAEQRLSRSLASPVHLRLQQVKLETAEQKPQADFLAGNAGKPAAEPQPVAYALRDAQERALKMLNSDTASLGIQRLQTIAFGHDEQGINMVFTATRKDPVSHDAWSVVAAEMASQLNEAVSLKGDLLVGDENPISLEFRHGSSALDPRSATRLRELLKKWKEQPDVRLVCSAPGAGASTLMGRRLAALQRIAGKKLVIVPASRQESGEPPDSMNCNLTQSVSESAELPASTPSLPQTPSATEQPQAPAH